MQDVTDLAFMGLVARRSPPDFFVTEYFRVYAGSRLDPEILRSITENDTGRPVFAQLIGESIPECCRIIGELYRYAIAGIDLNLGCPAPRVYRKQVGGGLLREPEVVDRLLGSLREAIPTRFTVKMRLGFEDTRHFETLIGLMAKHCVDQVTIHGRTVRDRYQGPVQYGLIGEAVARLPCPVLVNGDVISPMQAVRVQQQTGAAGVMIGRGAVRNPWIFGQIRQVLGGDIPKPVPLSEVYTYIRELYGVIARPGSTELNRVNALKKYLNFIGLGLDGDGAFLRQVRPVKTQEQLWQVCDQFLTGDRVLPWEPSPPSVSTSALISV
ncbi:MAG: tRNA-dihydrouridine synthase family protein [Oscillatoriales cyanobacterium SM2_2_1]|nr:tRNA-dihydrouridine synthase family protein [Oscillatoriales cyanobacterium SM2_2_1]